MAHSDGYRYSADGKQKLFYQAWQPEQENGRIFVVVHGKGEHSGRYDNLVDIMLPRGYVIYAEDHRGYGRSQGVRGHCEKFQDYIDDLHNFVDWVQQQHPGQEIIMIGHSLGGLITLDFALKYPEKLAAVVVSSPVLAQKTPVAGLELWLVRKLSRILPTFPIRNKTSGDSLSHEIGVDSGFDADPLCTHRVTPRFFTELTAAMVRTLNAAPNFTLPLLMLLAGDDKLVDPEVSRQFYDKVTFPHKKLIRYEGFYHELFNEIDRLRVFDDLNNWLEQHKPEK